MSGDTPIKLRIPQQDRAELEAFPLNSEGARAWVHSLPVAHSLEAAKQFYRVFAELNRVVMAAEVRYQILEVLRPSLSTTLTNLSRTFLNQPLVLAPKLRQSLELAARLYDMASVAYTVVAVHAVQEPGQIRSLPPALLVTEALQRALAFAGRKFLQTFQLYRPVELYDWLELHQLYALAEQQQLHDKNVRDPLLGNRNISSTYLQTMLLGCCRTNQLRPGESQALHRALRDWSRHVTLLRPGEGEGLFVIDLYSDQPPLYSKLYAKPRGNHCRHVDTSALVEHLQQLQQMERERNGKGIPFDEDIVLPTRLLDHMLEVMGTASTRQFSRNTTDRSLQINIGMTAAHYQLAGQRSFNQLLQGNNHTPAAGAEVAYRPFQEVLQERDVWHQANPEEDSQSGEGEALATTAALRHPMALEAETAAAVAVHTWDTGAERAPPTYEIHAVDVSPGGYCLEWSEELPGNILPGKLATVRENDNEPWSLAVLRWISRLEGARTLVGVELLSPRATAYGALVQKTRGGTTAPIRVLMLPEIPLVGQPETLITPQTGFHERQKLTLLRNGEECQVQLQHQIAATGSFRRFSFRHMQQLRDMVAQDKSGPLTSPYDSVWSNI